MFGTTTTSAGTGLFGAKPQTTGGLFGSSTPTAGGLFGSTVTGSLYKWLSNDLFRL